MGPWGKEKVITKEMMRDFHAVFFEDERGSRVLLRLGEEMHFFNDDLEEGEALHLRNMFVKILVMSGVWVQPNGEKILRGLEKENWLGSIGRAIFKRAEEPEQKGSLARLMEQKYGR
jgi:hypothetical protein